MVSGKHKSRSMRRVHVRTPSGRHVIHYRKRKPKKIRCSICGGVLHGVLRAGVAITRNTAKTKKVPSRAYGGNFCSRCSRDKIKERIRGN